MGHKITYDKNTIDLILELYIEGFRTNIKPEIIGNIKNLEFIPWEENIKKRTKCSITIEELNKI